MTDEREDALEVIALVRLGLHVSIDPDLSRERTLDRLVRQGKLAKHQALAARALVARERVECSCGWSGLGAHLRECPECGRALGALSGDDDPRVTRESGPPPRTLGPGARVGPLEVVKLIGRGASAIVYEVQHEQLKRRTALKVVTGAAVDEQARRLLEREVAALARIDDPAVAKVHGLHEVGDALGLEMELIDGETLDGRIERAGPLPWRDAASLVARLARALEKAHRAGILHRDLKPANVLIEKTGRVVLADFGLARLADASRSIAASGTLVGTPLFMAPETLGGAPATPRSDVYGLGALLFTAAMGRPPFVENSLAVLFHKVTKGLCDPIAIPGAPPDLEAIRARAMAPEADARFESALALARALEGALARDPSSAPRVEAPAPRSRRRTAFVLVGVLVGLALGALRSREKTETGSPGSDGRALDAERAVSVLESNPDDAKARSRALAALVADGSSDRKLVRARVEAALARREVVELRAARAVLARRANEPLDVKDLAAACATELPLDALALHALEKGVAGERPVDVVRELVRTRANVRALEELHGVLACASGEPSLRDEAVKALEKARPLQGRGTLLAQTLALADRVALSLAQEKDVATDVRKLGALMPQVARTTDLERATGVVLEPIARQLLEAWRTRRVDFAMRGAGTGGLLEMLASLEDKIPPRLIALRAVLRTASVGPDDPAENAPAAVERLARAAEALVSEEPLLAASAFDEAIRRDVPPLDLDDGGARVRRARLDLADEAIARAGRRGFTTDAEEATATMLARRHAENRGRFEEARAARERDPDKRKERLSQALLARRRALDASAASPLLARQRDLDARAVVGLLLALERLDELERPARSLQEDALRDAVAAEVLRRRGDAKGALALVERTLAATPETPAPDPWAVRAMAEAELGRIEEARKSLLRVQALEKTLAPVSEAFRAAAVEAFIEQRAKR